MGLSVVSGYQASGGFWVFKLSGFRQGSGARQRGFSLAKAEGSVKSGAERFVALRAWGLSLGA